MDLSTQQFAPTAFKGHINENFMISTLDQFCSDVSSFQGWLVVVVIIIDDSQKLLGWIWVGSVQPPKLKKKKKTL